VVNALAIKRLEEARRTHGERMEARMRTRARVRSGSAAVAVDAFEDADRHVYDTKRHEDDTKRHGDDSDHPPSSRFLASAGESIRGEASQAPRRAPSTSSSRRRRRRGELFFRGEGDGVARLRRLAHRLARPVVESEDFELAVVLVIFANCASLALHRPTDPVDGSWNRALDRFELALNGVFTLELALRVAHAGARAYFRDPWNRFDVALVVVGYSGVVADAFASDASDDAAASGGLRALRALRALRPLRTITRFESLRSVVVCFVEAVPLLVSVVGLVVFFAFTFAVAGQRLFREAYHLRCVDPATGAPESETSDEFGCAAPVGLWDDDAGIFVTWRDQNEPIGAYRVTRRSNARGSGRASHGRACPAGTACAYRDSGRGASVAGFDNAALGMLTVFQCATLAGWAQVMYRVMDAGAETAVPYFVLLVFFGPYFVVNLFLAVLKTKFGKAQSLFRSKIVARGETRRNTPARLFAAAAAKLAAYAERRRARAEAAEEELAAKLEASDGTWSRALERRRKMAALSEFCRELQEHRRFNHFFLGLIYLNTVLMAVEHHGMDPGLERALVVTNFVFTFFFAVEVAVKMIGLGAWTFFADGFNRFDFVIVFLAVVEVVAISGSSRLQSLKALRGLKVLRTFRVFKMFRYLASLRIIGEVILSSLGSFISIAVLLFLFLVVFAVVGLHVFGGLRDPDAFAYGVDDPQFGGRANFDSFYHSVLLTFQVLTLEDWEFIMFRTVEVAGWGGSAFFVLWVIVGKYTFLTLFLAVTMEAFESKYDSHASSEARLVARLLKKKRERRRRRFADMRRKKRQRRRREKAEAKRPEAKDHDADATDDEPTRETRREGGEGTRGTDDAIVSVSVATVSTDAPRGEKMESYGTGGKTPPPAETVVARLPGAVHVERDEDEKATEKVGAVPVLDPVPVPVPAERNDSASSGSDDSSGGSSSPGSGLSSGAMTPSGYGGLSGLASGAMTPNWGNRLEGLESMISSRQTSFSAVRSLVAGRRDRGEELSDRSCLCLPPHHPIREDLYDVVHHRAFDNLMFALIFVSCAAMALERPGMDPTLAARLATLDYCLTACFAAECAMKIVVFGFRRFARQRVNQLDLFIVASTLFEYALTSAGGLGAVRSLRILRAVRPLRALTKSSGMRTVLKSVALSVGAMVNVSVVMLMFFVIFGIMGVQIFAGRFYRCNDPSVRHRSECAGSFAHPTEGDVALRRWRNAYLNFDNLYRALVSLFVTSTLDGYGQIMFDALDSVEVDEQPRQDANPAAFLFFLAFVVLCAFSLLNLYVGVIFYQFSRIRMLSQTSSIDLTEEQKEWAEMCKSVLRVEPTRKVPPPRENAIRLAAYRVAVHPRFEKVVTAIVALNVVVLATAHHDEPIYWTALRDDADSAFACVYALEAAVKMTAFGFREYWTSGWNRFDLCVVAGAVVDAVTRDSDGAVARLVRLFRVARAFRLVKHAEGLRSLLSTLVTSLPAFWNVGALVLLLFFIYAYVGVLTFGSTRRGDNLNEHANFESFPTAMLTLFRVATNDEWVGLMRDCSDFPTGCREAGDCGSYAAYPFFVTFVVIVSMIMLNLFTAVIIENFENTQDHEEWKLSPDALTGYVRAFHEFDDGSGTVEGADLERLLRRVPPPLGIGAGTSRVLTVHFIRSLNVPLTPEGRVPFRRVAFELVRRVCECDMPPGEMRDRIEHGVRKAFPDIWEPIPDELSWSALMCVIRVQRHWRTLKANRDKRAREAADANANMNANASATIAGTWRRKSAAGANDTAGAMARRRGSSFAGLFDGTRGSVLGFFGNRVAPTPRRRQSTTTNPERDG
jgi:hypothetical protein